MEAGAIGQRGAVALRPAEKAGRSGRGPATIPLPLTEEPNALENGPKSETALSVKVMKKNILECENLII